jgi:hypothetical protein
MCRYVNCETLMGHVMSFVQHRLCQINVNEDFGNTVIPRPSRSLEGVITAGWSKPRCANFVWGKQGYVKADSYGHPAPPPPQSLNIYAFLDIKHLHSALIANADSFRGDCVNSRPRLSVYLNFFSVRQIPCTAYT